MPAEPGPSRKRFYAILILALILLAVALRLTVFAPDPVEVRVAEVARGTVQSTVTNSKAGTVEARRRSRIAPEIGGRVVEIRRREGERVKAGEVLVRLAEESLRARLEQAKEGVPLASARLEDACLRRDRARRELERTERLAEQKVASADRLDALQYAFDSARVACEAAKSELAQAKANLRASESELAKTTITAPFDGIVAEVNVEVGEWVTPSPPLLTSPAVIDLIDPTSIYVSAPMDEVDAGAIRPGLPVRVSVDSQPGTSFPGRVLRVAPYVLDTEAQNRTLEIEVELEDQKVAEALLPGTSADAEVILDTREDVVRIPTSALLRSEKVLVLEDDLLVERAVELGLRNWQYAEVKRGVELGERVVVSLDSKAIVAGARALAAVEDAPEAGAAR
ncbi:MAG: efflux RND transporter periplasmic adaptor subunit [Deltaproteobacteria bacterium]|nr:efflux RND transporter periplasmic adaptor subunit [Deltaproteobacteria bacterium]